MPAARLVPKCSAIAVWILLFGLCALLPSAAQTGGNTSGGSTTKGSPPASTRTTPPPQQQERRPVFLSGRVVLDDGTPPAERVAIERVCSGLTRRETYTDSQGQFSMQLGAEPQVFQDATVGSAFDASRGPGMGDLSGSSPSRSMGMPSTGVTTGDLMSCELRASLPGFRSDTISLAGHQLFDNPDVGTIVLHRLGKVQGTRISITTMKAPKDARKAYERGASLLKKQRPVEAEEEFGKAVALYPQYADALVRLGEIRADQGHNDEASALLQRAIDADPQLIPPYFDLALIAGHKQEWQRMADLSDRALALNAYEYPVAYYFNAVANYNLHKLEVAERNARAARRLDSQHHIPRIDLVLANILLRRNDYAGAAEQLRSFLKYAPSGEDATTARELLGQTESKLAVAPKPQ
jgi:Tfp pilus assembly protein PilF